MPLPAGVYGRDKPSIEYLTAINVAAMSEVQEHLVGLIQATGSRTKWGPVVTGGRNGYQVLPDVLVRHQARLKLNCTDMVVLLNVLMHWWEKEPENLPHPRPDQIASRIGASPRTVQRCIKKMSRAGLIQWMPPEKGKRGLAIRRFKFEGLLRKLQALALENEAFEKNAA